MLKAILILLIFSIGLNLILIGGVVAVLKEHTTKLAKALNDNTRTWIEDATTAVFNMDSLKQKAEMSGEVEV